MADSTKPWVEQPALDKRGFVEDRDMAAMIGRGLLAVLPVVAAGSWIGYYLLTDLPFIELDAFAATIRFHVVTAIVLVLYLVWLIAARRLPGPSVLDIPVVVFLCASLLATVTSQDWRVSLEVTLTAFLAAGAFYVLSDRILFRRWQVELALTLAILALAIDALWVVGSDYAEWLRLTNAVQGSVSLSDIIPPTVPKVHNVGDHPNIVGGILAMGVPFFVVGAVRRGNPLVRAAFALAAVTVLVACFFSLARSAWLGAVVGIAVTGILLLGATPEGRALAGRGIPQTTRARWLSGGAVAAATLALVLVGLAAFQSIEARPEWLFRDSGSPRADVIEAGWEMWRDHPFMGIGPGVYGQLYPLYSGLHPNHAFHAHNGYLQALIDLGVPGILSVALMVVALFWLVWHGLQRAEGAARLSVIACAGSMAALAAFSVFDTPNGSKGPMITLAAVGAVLVLVGWERPSEERPRLLDNAVMRFAWLGARAAVPVAIAVMLVVWARLDLSHAYYDRAVEAANGSAWNTAIEEIDRAVELDPDLAIYRLQFGVIEGQAYFDTRDPAHLDAAIAQLERAIDLEPIGNIARANLALLYAERGQRDETREQALAALRYLNSDHRIAMLAGNALEQTSWDDDAIEAYASAISLDHELARSEYWERTDFRIEHFPEIVERSNLGFNPCERLRISSDDAPEGPLHRETALFRCAALVKSKPGQLEGRVALAEAFVEDRAYSAAKRQLDYVLAREPDNGPARTVLGSWHDAQGRVDAARAEWQRAGQLGEEQALVLLRDSYPPGGAPKQVTEALNREERKDVHLAGILYYRIKFYRASPFTFLFPIE